MPLKAKSIATQRPRPHAFVCVIEDAEAASAQDALRDAVEVGTIALQSFETSTPVVCTRSVTPNADNAYNVRIELRALTGRSIMRDDVALKMDAAVQAYAQRNKLATRKLGPDHENAQAPVRPPKKPKPSKP